jgi:hypothetical protein
MLPNWMKFRLIRPFELPLTKFIYTRKRRTPSQSSSSHRANRRNDPVSRSLLAQADEVIE